VTALDFEERRERKKPWQTFSGGLGCGCLTFIVIGAIVIGPAFYRARKSPEIRCQANLTAIGAAVMKYRDDHDEYPKSLEELVKEYPRILKSEEVLYCPLTKGSRESRRYQYHPPGPDTMPYDPLIVCRRHQKVVLALLKNCMVTGWPPSMEPGADRPEPPDENSEEQP
jgi:hypothetical protein